MKRFVIYEHIHGLCSFLDTVEDEITSYAMEYCNTAEDVEEYVKYINKIQPLDRYERKRNLYVWWFCD